MHFYTQKKVCISYWYKNAYFETFISFSHARIATWSCLSDLRILISKLFEQHFALQIIC